MAQYAEADPWQGYQPASPATDAFARAQATPPPKPGVLDFVGGLGRIWADRLAGLGQGLYESAASGATLAPDVLAGRVDPKSEEGIRRALDMGGLAMGGGLTIGAPVSAGEQLLGAGVRGARQPTARELVTDATLQAAIADRAAAKPALQFVEPKGTPSYQTIYADTNKLDASLAKDPGNYVGPGGTGEGAIKGRYERFHQFAQTGEPVEMPMVTVGPKGEATVSNGRHRLAYIRDQGHETVPVRVPNETADEFRTKFGAAEPGTQPVAGNIGDLANPAVLFRGKSPGEFSPSEWGAFGKQYGVPNLGPESDEAFTKSLKSYKTESGKDYTVPGGIETKDPFSYYDLLHLKQQGINPNDLKPEVHQAIHDRMVATMSPPGEVTPERMMNQLILAQISPNQPLTPNELAVARTMVKGPEDLQKLGEMVPWRHDADPSTISKEMRSEYSDKIANTLGLGAASKGGLGARGTADYTRIAETAQRMQQDPEFFRFRGEGEGGKTSAENWANFVERLSNQTPGLSSKTGSFGAVWQNPAAADISAVDRHMAGKFTADMFPSPEAYDAFKQQSLERYAASPASKGKAVPETFEELPNTFKNDQMFGYLNNNPGMVYRGKPPKGSNSGVGLVNPRVPEHLQPEQAGWINEPKNIELMSDPYRRVLAANAAEANKAGQSIFGSQWMLWDRIRNRLEPHEIMFPGLEKLPRMSMEQMQQVRSDLKNAGYFSSTKGEEGLAQVRQLPSASRAGYFAAPGVPIPQPSAQQLEELRRQYQNRGAVPEA